MPQERVQKILAQAGIASRRKAEELILEGAVTINGRVAQLGDKAEWGKDAIKVNGKLLHSQEKKAYYAFYKPKNVISSLSDPQGRPCIGDYLNRVHERVYPVGRLDFGTEGLILLTNDGEFLEKVQKSSKLPRFYEVKVKGSPDDEMLMRIRAGQRINGRPIRPISVRVTETLTSNSKVELVFKGSGTLDLKAIFEDRGFAISRILRTGIGHLKLDGMRPGDLFPVQVLTAYQLIEEPELALTQWREEVEAQKAAEERKKNRLAVMVKPGGEAAEGASGTGRRTATIRGRVVSERDERSGSGRRGSGAGRSDSASSHAPGASRSQRPMSWGQKNRLSVKSKKRDRDL